MQGAAAAVKKKLQWCHPEQPLHVCALDACFAAGAAGVQV
jgi:hypothetical protein